MCIARSGQVLRVAGEAADVEVAGRVVAVSLLALGEPVSPGDWLLVHSGVAVARLTDDDVQIQRQLRGEPR